jgi:DnaJ-class molecular chaperone
MSFFPDPTISTSYCLTCAGTGKRGNLSGKKACKTCGGSGKRTIQHTKNDKPVNATVCEDFNKIIVPTCYYTPIKDAPEE